MNIDKKILKLGFIKVSEDNYTVIYERENISEVDLIETYIQQIYIRVRHHNLIIFSAQKEMNSDGYQNAVALTFKELKLVNKKITQMKLKRIINKLKELVIVWVTSTNYSNILQTG